MKFLYASIVFLFVAASSWAQQYIDPRVLQELDSSPDLVKATGYDRLSKFLIATADPRNQQHRITRAQVLDKVIIQMIKEGTAFDLIGRDLARGDVYLRDTLINILQSFNFSVQQANMYVDEWATTGANEIVRKAMNNITRKESVLKILSRYSMETPKEWTSVIQGMSDIFEGKSPISIPLMADIIVRSRAMSDQTAKQAIADVQKGSIPARWDLALGMTKIMDAHGALARFLEKSKVPEGSWNFTVWKKVVERIGDDPLLRSEYIDRLSHSAPLYDNMRSVLIDAIEKEGDKFILGYLDGARIPGSPFDWTANYLQKLTSDLRELKKSYTVFVNLRQRAREEIGKKLRNTGGTGYRWTNHFFWHLTRPGEAIVFATRIGMARGLANDETVARELTRNMTPFGDEFQQILIASGAFNYYKGGESEFREKVKTGTIERAALLHYSAALGRILLPEAGDRAWTLVLSRDNISSNALLKKMLESAVHAEPDTLLGWLGTIRNNDKLLRARFIEYLKAEGRIKSNKNFDTWIESVGAAIATGNVVGNNDVADFKGWFIDFFNTNAGWDAIRLRMEVESIKVPYRLRSAMEEVFTKEPDRFWRIYSMLTAATGPSVATLLPDIERYTIASRIPQFLLEEIALRNVAAADAVDPVWAIMFSDKSPLPDRIIKFITDGAVSDEIYRLCIMALTKVLSDDRYWNKVRSQAIHHLKAPKDISNEELRRSMFEQMNLHGFESLPFISKALAEPSIKKSWRSRMLNSVKFLGQAYIVADFIQRQEEVQPYWAKGIAKIVSTEPRIMKVILEALASRRVGDVVWDEQVAQARREVIRIVLDDRVLFEQLANEQLSNWKTTEFRARLDKKLKSTR